MDFFLNNYKVILNYAEGVIFNSKIGRLSSLDLVNEAYVRCWESLEADNINEVKKIIRKIYFEESIQVGFLHTSVCRRIIGDEYCKGCKEILPVCMFRIIYRNGFEYLSDKCKSCENQYATAYQKANKKKAVQAYKKYYEKNKNLVHLRTKMWLEKEKASLSDKYIIRVLTTSGKYKKADIEANPNLVVWKRASLIEKQNKSKS